MSRLSRAFSAIESFDHEPWGVAQTRIDIAPLALTDSGQDRPATSATRRDLDLDA
jgi:hypothetical protein